MANKTNSARQTHVSPGIYTSETELSYAAKSLGITTLGLVGETLKGPAFQPIEISKWDDYQRYFGGTSPEKFIGSQYPKYELPYIAKSYLEESQQLQVCRVLGLSGVNAGAAWLLTAYGDENNNGEKSAYPKDKPLVIGVLRSRGEHRKAAFLAPASPENGICEDQYEYDKIVYYAQDVYVTPSKKLNLGDVCNPGFTPSTNEFTMNSINYGTFTLTVTTDENELRNYSVTLNPNDKNYILNVLGTDPSIGDTEIYVEELYDVAIQQLIEQGEIEALAFVEPQSDEDRDKNIFRLYKYDDVKVIPSHKVVTDILLEDESMLTRKYVGRRYLYSSEWSKNEENGSALKVHISYNQGKTWVPVEGLNGHIYTVIPHTTANGTREYYYGEYVSDTKEEGNDTIFNYNVGAYYPSSERNFATEYLKISHTINSLTKVFTDAVEVAADNLTYIALTEGNKEVVRPITLDLNNYKEHYRYASTPWVVSEMKGSAEHVELTKLFRFHTISDGSTANTEVKVSIANIDPENGTFDVLVRNFYDTDASPVILEHFSQCNLVPGTSKYISYLIGSTDESYETRSNYITVEVNENDKTKSSIPAGFLGYPVRDFSGVIVMEDSKEQPTVSKPYFKYNTNVNEDIRINKQYFGLSNLTGIDEDILRYKGVEAYNGLPNGLSPCFHLDSRILSTAELERIKISDPNFIQTVTVDGVDGYDWVTVGKSNVTEFGIEPRIGTEEDMINTIYEDKRYRKFTIAFYGGWDGWDYYRTQRSTGDEFTYNKYRGNIDRTSGEGVSFSVINNNEEYDFDVDTKALTSDYYAYLAGVRTLANPKTIDLNVLATPGIDYVNNKLLVDEVISIVEDERADCVYVVTTPDKPNGAGDSVSEMYTPDDVVTNLEDSDIDSNYTCTFYPWVKYYDSDNSQYVYLPVTRDVVRNFAYTDNTTYPWFAASGWNRGTINGIRPRKTLKLSDQDTLYGGRINFVNSFPDEGLKIWGDKNLQIHESQMNRISKRRLLVRIRKLLAIACIGLLFDPNDNTTKKAFESAVEPILRDIQTKRGLIDFRIVVDDSQEARDRLELPAKIYLKLQPNLEYINISMIVTPSGVSFDDI